VPRAACQPSVEAPLTSNRTRFSLAPPATPPSKSTHAATLARPFACPWPHAAKVAQPLAGRLPHAAKVAQRGAGPARSKGGTIQRMERPPAPPIDWSRIDVDTGVHTENDRAALRALVAHPFYAVVIRDLLARDEKNLSIRTTLPSDRTQRAIWAGAEKQIRVRPDQVDGGVRSELIKWELVNGWRRYVPTGVDEGTGPDHYADQVEEFEYGTALEYAAQWREGDPVIFDWVPTLRKNLQAGSPMSAKDWAKAIARSGHQHYRDAQGRYLEAHGARFLATPGGARWLTSRSGAWFRGSEQWKRLSESSRRRIEEQLRPLEVERKAERDDLGNDIARTLAEARAARSRAGDASATRAEPPHKRARSPHEFREPARRIEAYVRWSESRRNRLVIDYLRIYENGTSHVEQVHFEGNRLWVYFDSQESVRGDVAREHRLTPSQVQVIVR
jgi:hypothetical protein